MKTKEELTALKKEYEMLSNRLAELSEDELAEVTGGMESILRHGRSGPAILHPTVMLSPNNNEE